MERTRFTLTLALAAFAVGGSTGDVGAKGREGRALDRRPTPLTELALHPNRWVGKLVVVEGKLYKFPGNRVSSAKVQDQLVCNRIDRFPPGGKGAFCVFFWGVRVQDVPGARRSPDGGWWVSRPVRLGGRLRGFPYPTLPVGYVALGATGWQSATGAPVAQRRPLLALVTLPKPGVVLQRVDPLSLEPRSAQVLVGEYHDAWSLSPDRSQLALGVSAPGRKKRIGIFIVDVRAMRVVSRVETGIAAVALDWLAPRRLVASLQAGGTVLVDPLTGKVLRRWPGLSYPDASARTPRGFVMLFGGKYEALFESSPVQAPRSIVPRLGVVDARGRLRSVPLARIGLTVRPRLYSADRAALAVDTARARAYVFAAEAPAATVDLRTMRVSYRSVALGPRGGSSKKVLVRDRSAAWLGNERVLVFGYDRLPRTGRQRFPSMPAGATLVDTADWSTRVLDPTADSAVLVKGMLLAYRSRGVARDGLRMYTVGGRRVATLLRRKRVLDVQVARASAYVLTPGAVYVLDVPSRRIVNKIVPPVEIDDVIVRSS